MRLAAIVILAGLLALALFRASYGRFTLNREPLVSPPPVPVNAKPTRRVLFIVLDGARADVVPEVPVLKGLGELTKLEADLPTISAAQYTSLLTGATPQTSGRRGNDGISPVKLDSVPALVRRGGGTTAVFSDCVDWWPRLFPDAWNESAGSSFENALALARGPYDFVLVHLCAFDDAGHAFGGAQPQYRVGAALQVQWKLTALLAAWGNAGPVLVTSDHGHRDGGGHGGDEPEVRTTFLVASEPGSRPKGRAVDVAGTLAATMGLPAPVISEEDAAKKLAVLEAEAFLSRVLRAASALAVLLLIAALARRQLLGLACGAAALVIGCAAYAVFIGPVSPSAMRTFGVLVQTTLLIGLSSGVIAIVPLMRLREGRVQALLAAAAGSSPLVVWMYTVYGVAAPRITVGSAWSIALPSLAWAGWGGTLIVLLIVAAATSMRRAPSSPPPAPTTT